jgi:cell division protein FtsB
MGDLGSRIRRYRLSRYARPESPLRHRMAWVWLALAGWVLWAGFVSDHSFLQLWRLERERAQIERRLGDVRQEIDRLEAAERDPNTKQQQAEENARVKNGMARPGEIVYLIRGDKADSLAH